MNSQTILNIPVSGNNPSLTGNDGNKWESHFIDLNFGKDYDPLMNTCNNSANEQIQTQSHDQVLNSNFTTDRFNSGKEIETYYHCEAVSGLFYEKFYDTTTLPL
jgi:hypothetical protein